jgi:hypothetical protein
VTLVFPIGFPLSSSNMTVTVPALIAVPSDVRKIEYVSDSPAVNDSENGFSVETGGAKHWPVDAVWQICAVSGSEPKLTTI